MTDGGTGDEDASGKKLGKNFILEKLGDFCGLYKLDSGVFLEEALNQHEIRGLLSGLRFSTLYSTKLPGHIRL